MTSIAKTDLENRVLGLVGTVLNAQGFRAVDVDCFIANKSLIRVFIEKMGEKQTSVEDCANMSQLIGPTLEAEDVVPGAYDLEVSSPGLDRRLRLVEDFQECIGKEIKLRLSESIPGVGSKPSGELLGVEKDSLKMSFSGKESDVPLELIRRANLVWKF